MSWCEKCKEHHLKHFECPHGDRSLSKREKEVIELIAEGRNNKSIAEILSISIHTTRVHLKNLYIKLDIDSNKYDKRLKLALMGQELGRQDEIHQKVVP